MKKKSFFSSLPDEPLFPVSEFEISKTDEESEEEFSHITFPHSNPKKWQKLVDALVNIKLDSIISIKVFNNFSLKKRQS
jgi:hypothetical protein